MAIEDDVQALQLVAQELQNKLAQQSKQLDDVRQQISVRTAPVGTIAAFAGEPDKVPKGWRLCNGDPLVTNDPIYADLFVAIGYAWGGSGTKFYLPDLQGRFLRGVDRGAGRDPDAGSRAAGQAGGNDKDRVGSAQDDAFQTHRHTDSGHAHGYTQHIVTRRQYAHEGPDLWPPADWTDNGAGTTGSNANVTEPTATPGITLRVSSETRPRNANVHWIIKYALDANRV